MNNILRLESRSADDTFALGQRLAAEAQPGAVYALCGELGAGKTVFAQGFARGLGYEGTVTSPTFTLMNVYEGGRLTLYHFDIYRFTDAAEGLEEIGYEDFLYADGVCLIEWAERAAGLLPQNTVQVCIERIPDGSVQRGDGFDNPDAFKRMITIE